VRRSRIVQILNGDPAASPLGGAHKRGAPYSSHRAPQRVRLRSLSILRESSPNHATGAGHQGSENLEPWGFGVCEAVCYGFEEGVVFRFWLSGPVVGPSWS